MKNGLAAWVYLCRKSDVGVDSCNFKMASIFDELKSQWKNWSLLLKALKNFVDQRIQLPNVNCSWNWLVIIEIVYLMPILMRIDVIWNVAIKDLKLTNIMWSRALFGSIPVNASDINQLRWYIFFWLEKRNSKNLQWFVWRLRSCWYIFQLRKDILGAFHDLFEAGHSG